uniref:Ribosomal protein L5 n=1 Tax=Reclinomonas americana ATCC 50284 TaxID=1295595 RepID=M4QLZ5_RECAM|nr:ribosomal protein L5 [Reclinomonas americana ATCC 50284]
MNRLKKHYEEIIRFDMIRKFNYINPHMIPKLDKIVVNMGVKEAALDKKQILAPLLILELITGQKAIITKAKKSISNFKIRKGFPIGVSVTLRGDNMYEFLSRLVTVVLPKIRDFKGIPMTSINKDGNLAIGIKDLLVFPEIESEYDKFNRVYGANIVLVTTAKTKKEAGVLLSGFQIPLKIR